MDGIPNDVSSTINDACLTDNIWFSIVAQYEARIFSSGDILARQELVFLVRAQNQSVAFGVGNQVAVAKQHTYLNADGEMVEWRFVEINEILELFDKELGDGTEVFWRIDTNDQNPGF